MWSISRAIGRPAAATAILLLAAMQGFEPDKPAEPEARSLLGRPLVAPPLSPEKRRELEDKLAEAHAALDANPGDEGAIIWLGRRLAYLYRYNDAIDVFSRGLNAHKDSFRLRRHRGHRFITTRSFDLAIVDLTKAAELVAGVPDEVEPDGAPNSSGTPTSTTQTNIFYHLGLAQYLKGQFEPAATAYRRCFELSKNDDMRVAAAHWLYLSLRRLGRDDEARGLIEPLGPEMTILENHMYHKLILLYKGLRSQEETTAGLERGSVEEAAVLYGVGGWHLVNGRRDEARAVFAKMVEGPMWPAFGQIAAEADLRRMMDEDQGIRPDDDDEEKE
jgi:tetratricopeptide (TPR) repeat protein